MSTLKMAIDALNADSGRWHEVSGSLKEAATAADGLDVYSFSFPGMADVDLYPVYAACRTRWLTCSQVDRPRLRTWRTS